MRTGFAQSLRQAAAWHAGLLAFLLTVPALHNRFFRSRQVVVPVDLVVEPETVEEPVARVEERVPPAEQPPLRPARTITKSTRVVVRSSRPEEPVRAPGQEEIARLLRPTEARSRGEEALASEDARDLEIVRRAFYEAWRQPTVEEAGQSAASVTIRLADDGRVAGGELTRPSGNAVFDRTVRAALGAVERVNGLSRGFLERNREVVVTFRVEAP